MALCETQCSRRHVDLKAYYIMVLAHTHMRTPTYAHTHLFPWLCPGQHKADL